MVSLLGSKLRCHFQVVAFVQPGFLLCRLGKSSPHKNLPLDNLCICADYYS